MCMYVHEIEEFTRPFTGFNKQVGWLIEGEKGIDAVDENYREAMRIEVGE